MSSKRRDPGQATNLFSPEFPIHIGLRLGQASFPDVTASTSRLFAWEKANLQNFVHATLRTRGDPERLEDLADESMSGAVKKGIKAIVGFELLALAGAYGVFHG